MDMQTAHEAQEHSDDAQRAGPGSEVDVAEVVAAARERVRARSRGARAEPVPVTRVPLDGLIGMGDAHPYRRVLARSSGRSQTIRAIDSNTRMVTRMLRKIGACGVPKDEPSWDDPLAFPWHRFSEHDAAMLMATLTETTRNANTFAARVNRVRAILTQCRRQRLIDRERLEECFEILETPQPDDAPAGRALEESEIERLFDACARDKNPLRGARDAAILAVLFTTGIRGCELCELDLVHYEPAERQLEVLPKGRRVTRRVYLNVEAAGYLEEWVALRGGEPGPLLHRWRGSGPRLTVGALNRRLAKLVEAAGIAPFSSHDCRRTVATRLLRRADIVVVMKVLGHKQPTTTARYDRASDEHLRRAVDQIVLPGRARHAELEGEATSRG